MIRDYLYTIGKYLPASERNDILKEIECGIYDYLQAEFGNKDYTSNEIESALIKMGDPKRVAYAYTGNERNLIAPIYLDIYSLIVKVAIFGISIAFIVIAILSFIESDSLFSIIVAFFNNLCQAGLMMLGIVTLIFATISKFDRVENKFTVENEEWSIKDLDKAPINTNVIKTSDIVIESIFIVLFLTFVNSAYFSLDLEYNGFLVALNTDVFSKFIIWFNISLVFNLTLNFFLLVKKEWSTLNRILSIISDFIGLVLFGVLAFNPNLINFDNVTELPADVLESLNFATSIGFKIGFFAVLVITLFEVFKHIKLILNSNNSI